MPLYTRFVQIGRVVQVQRGEDVGKLAVIVDIIDQNRLLIDGPSTGVPRQVIKTDYISLTDFTVTVQRGARGASVKKAFESTDVAQKFSATPSGKRLARRALRSNLSDFQRFQVLSLRRQRNTKVTGEFRASKKEYLKSNPSA